MKREREREGRKRRVWGVREDTCVRVLEVSLPCIQLEFSDGGVGSDWGERCW